MCMMQQKLTLWGRVHAVVNIRQSDQRQKCCSLSALPRTTSVRVWVYKQVSSCFAVFSTADRHQSDWACQNNKIKRRYLLILLESISWLVFSGDEILLKATYRQWPKSVDHTLNVVVSTTILLGFFLYLFSVYPAKKAWVNLVREMCSAILHWQQHSMFQE